MADKETQPLPTHEEYTAGSAAPLPTHEEYRDQQRIVNPELGGIDWNAAAADPRATEIISRTRPANPDASQNIPSMRTMDWSAVAGDPRQLEIIRRTNEKDRATGRAPGPLPSHEQYAKAGAREVREQYKLPSQRTGKPAKPPGGKQVSEALTVAEKAAAIRDGLREQMASPAMLAYPPAAAAGLGAMGVIESDAILEQAQDNGYQLAHAESRGASAGNAIPGEPVSSPGQIIRRSAPLPPARPAGMFRK